MLQRGGRMRASALLCACLVVGYLSGALAADVSSAGPPPQRIELFAPDGRRQGHAIIERDGRIELFDAQYRRQGWGRIDPDGRLELFSPKGERLGSGRVKR